MGSAKNRRQLFNLSQAKSYMQSMLVASGTKKLIDQGKTTSLRGLYYMLKHTIEGTRRNVRRSERIGHDHRRYGGHAQRTARRVAPVREKRRFDGGADYAVRFGRYDRLLAHGFGRLYDSIDRRAGNCEL